MPYCAQTFHYVEPMNRGIVLAGRPCCRLRTAGSGDVQELALTVPATPNADSSLGEVNEPQRSGPGNSTQVSRSVTISPNETANLSHVELSNAGPGAGNRPGIRDALGRRKTPRSDN